LAKRIYKPPGVELESFDRRNYLLRGEYPNKCAGKEGKSFVKQFPTNLHYLYHESLYWFHYDLILQNESWQKQLDPVEHWNVCKFYEEAVHACELKHSYDGDFEQLKKFQLASDYVLECARDVYKSYLAVSCAIWVMGKHRSWTNLFARATDKGSSKRLNHIAKHLLSNQKLFKYFPHLEVKTREIKKRKLEFSKDMLFLSSGFDSDDDGSDEVTYAIRREYTSEANMNGWGLNSSYTGAHIDGMAFIDDSVTEDNYLSEQVQDTLYGHLSELDNITRETAVRMFIDTPYSEHDAIQRKKRAFVAVQKEEKSLGNDVVVWKHYSRPALQLEGYTTQECLDFLLKGKKGSAEAKLAEKAVVFKSCHTPRTLRKKYHNAKSKRFFWSQYLLEIIPETDITFKEEWLTFYGHNTAVGLAPPRSDMRVVGLIDPAGAKNRGTDDMAILVIGVDKSEISWILEAIQGKFTSKGLMDMVQNIDIVYNGLDEWHMENYGMGEEYRGLLQQIMNSNQSTVSLLPLHGGTDAGAKYNRIESSTWVWEMRRVRIQERHEEFLKQYRAWRRPPPSGFQDHLLDLFGYFKNMIYSNTSAAALAERDDYTSTVGTLSELKTAEILYMRNKSQKKYGNSPVYCIANWHEMTLDEVAGSVGSDNQPKCKKCGSGLWFGSNQPDASMYDMGMCN